jgi:hypothetical protein
LAAHLDLNDPYLFNIERVVFNVTGGESFEAVLSPTPQNGWFRNTGWERWYYAPAEYDGETLILTVTGYSDSGRLLGLGRVEIEAREKQLVEFEVVSDAR